MKKKHIQVSSAPLEYILNLGDKLLIASALEGQASDAVSDEAEPPMTSGDLLELSTSQLVDAHAVITHTKGPPEHKGKSVLKVCLCDGSGKEITLNLWDDMITKLTGVPWQKTCTCTVCI